MTKKISLIIYLCFISLICIAWDAVFTSTDTHTGVGVATAMGRTVVPPSTATATDRTAQPLMATATVNQMALKQIMRLRLAQFLRKPRDGRTSTSEQLLSMSSGTSFRAWASSLPLSSSTFILIW